MAGNRAEGKGAARKRWPRTWERRWRKVRRFVKGNQKAVLGTLLGVVILLLAVGLLALAGGGREAPIEEETAWSRIAEESAGENLDAGFVYAIAMAESSLKPRADSGYARGIMQLSKVAWKEVSNQPYWRAFNWKLNIKVGVDYLAWLRDELRSERKFSYPVLAACYRYGYYHVKARGFSLSRLQEPKNRIYHEIFSGNINPVEIPDGEEPEEGGQEKGDG